MHHTPARPFPVSVRLATFLLLIITAGAVAATTYPRYVSGTVGFTCDDGDRFVVEYLPGHVRLRDGSGIFALTRENVDEADANVYSDGRLIFRADNDIATLERIELGILHECTAEAASL